MVEKTIHFSRVIPDYTNSRCFIDLDRWFVDVGGLLEFGKSKAKIEEEHVTSIDLAQATHEYA